MDYATTKLNEITVNGRLFGLLPGETTFEALNVYARTQGHDTFYDLEKADKRHADGVTAIHVELAPEGLTFTDRFTTHVAVLPQTMDATVEAWARDLGYPDYTTMVLENVERRCRAA